MRENSFNQYSRKNGQSIEEQQNEESTTDQQNNQCTITTNDANGYSQYVNKVWVVKDSTENSSYNYPSFRISKIVNGKIVVKYLNIR